MLGKKSILALLIYLPMAGAWAVPHFFLQMENRSNKTATISFTRGEGNVFLVPDLADRTPLAAQAKSVRYQVDIEPVGPHNSFNILFAGQELCQFTVGYFSPGNPKIDISGLGCRGGGYEIIDNGKTLLLYVSDIKLKG